VTVIILLTVDVVVAIDILRTFPNGNIAKRRIFDYLRNSPFRKSPLYKTREEEE
jgi:hypothetical protein